MLPFIAVLGSDLLDLGGTWVVWSAGLAAGVLALWFLRRHPTEARGMEAQALPGPSSL
jgi:hypothetical protein